MKKSILFLLTLVFSCAALQARTVDVSATYAHASHFDQVKAGADAALSLNVFAGLHAKYVKEDAFKDPVYSVSVPVRLEYELLQIHLTPFYYFENKSDNPAYQNASAYGLSTRLLMTLQDDQVNDLYTHAYIGVSYASQKGTAFFNDGKADENQDFSQMAYTLGLHQNFFRAFGFEAAANVFQYPSGITGISSFRGVMDQQDLAFMQTFDVVHDLPKYTLGGRLTRMWTENQSSLYLGYRYGEFYTADPEHSFIVGNTFIIAKAINADIAYNHVRTTQNENKRDIFYIRLAMSF